MSTTQLESSEPPLHEYTLRNRLRNDSITTTQTRKPSPGLPNKAVGESVNEEPPWIRYCWLFVALLICLPAFHIILGSGLKAFRYRTYARSHMDGHISRMDFLTSILPTALRHLDGELSSPILAQIPLSAPFASIDVSSSSLEDDVIHATVSQLHRIEAKYNICSQDAFALASARKHTYVAKAALEKLQSTISNTMETKGTPISDLVSKVAEVVNATMGLEKVSERFEMHRALLAPHDIEDILRNGVQAQKQKAAKRTDARLRVACKAKTYKETIQKLDDRVPILLKLTEDMRHAVSTLNKALLKLCQNAAETTEQSELSCSDSLSVLWKMFRPRSSSSPKELEELSAAKTEAGAAADALSAKLEEMQGELKVQRNGIDVWMMFLETLSGRC